MAGGGTAIGPDGKPIKDFNKNKNQQKKPEKKKPIREDKRGNARMGANPYMDTRPMMGPGPGMRGPVYGGYEAGGPMRGPMMGGGMMSRSAGMMPMGGGPQMGMDMRDPRDLRDMRGGSRMDPYAPRPSPYDTRPAAYPPLAPPRRALSPPGRSYSEFSSMSRPMNVDDRHESPHSRGYIPSAQTVGIGNLERNNGHDMQRRSATSLESAPYSSSQTSSISMSAPQQQTQANPVNPTEVPGFGKNSSIHELFGKMVWRKMEQLKDEGVIDDLQNKIMNLIHDALAVQKGGKPSNRLESMDMGSSSTIGARPSGGQGSHPNTSHSHHQQQPQTHQGAGRMTFSGLGAFRTF